MHCACELDMDTPADLQIFPPPDWIRGSMILPYLIQCYFNRYSLGFSFYCLEYFIVISYGCLVHSLDISSLCLGYFIAISYRCLAHSLEISFLCLGYFTAISYGYLALSLGISFLYVQYFIAIHMDAWQFHWVFHSYA